MRKPSLRTRLKARTLRIAEDFAYDLVGLPEAIKYLLGAKQPSPEHEPTAYIRHVYARQYWHRGFWGPVRGGMALLVWPFAFLYVAARFTSRNGGFVQRLTGKNSSRQLYEQLSLALRQSMVPYWYYMFEIYDDHRRSLASLYLQRYETKGPIYGMMQPRRPDGMQDKSTFARLCREAGVPAAPVLLELTGGSIVFVSGKGASFPREDLFVKPRVGRGGRNAERWDFNGTDKWKDAEGRELDEEGLKSHLTALSQENDYIVQPRVKNHPDLAPVNNGALATVRMVTCRNELGEPEATDAAFRMANGRNTTVDNFHAGGIAAAVDMKSGRLGQASNMGLRPGVGWCSVHPDSGAAIEGRVLPLWSEVIELACNAHRAFPERVIVGWDIGILAGGPVVIEGNIKPDLDIHQRVTRAPLGDKRLASLLALNVAKILAEERT